MSIKDKDLNPETQLRELREHAAELYGAVLVSEFIDKASANDLRGRRRWRELLIARQHSQLDLIVVWRLDRAFRSILNCATTLGRPRAWGCGRRRLQEPWIDTTTPIGEAMFHITIAWAGLGKRTLAERTRAAWSGLARRGSRSAGPGGNRWPLTHGSRRSATWSWPGPSPGPRARAGCGSGTRRSSPPWRPIDDAGNVYPVGWVGLGQPE